MMRFTTVMVSLGLCVCFLMVDVALADNTSSLNGEVADGRTDRQGCLIDFGVTPDDFGGSLGPFGYPGTPLDTQFVLNHSIVFGAAVDSERPDTVLVSDCACPEPDMSCDRSSGSPPYETDWWCQFKEGVGPGQPGDPAYVTWFSAEICYIDNPPPVVYMEGYNNEKEVIVTASSTMQPREILTVTAPAGEHIAYVRIISSADPAGLSIDCLDYDYPLVKKDIPTLSQWGLAVVVLLLAAGLAYRFGWRRTVKPAA